MTYLTELRERLGTLLRPTTVPKPVPKPESDAGSELHVVPGSPPADVSSEATDSSGSATAVGG